MKYLNLIVLFLLIPTALQSQPKEEIKQGISLERLKRYERFINTEIEGDRLPGAITMISRNGEVVHQAAYGYSNAELKKPMQLDNIFNIQSMTKCIISVAFMTLYEEGKFQLTDPVSMYLPAFKDLKVINDKGENEALEKEVTIFNLLTHTSGMGNQSNSHVGKEISTILVQSYPNIESRVDDYLELPLIYQPGEKWYYSISPDVLSVLIEIFSGMSTEEFLKERLFRPLKMNDTGYNVPREKQSRVVQLHQHKLDTALKIISYPNKIGGNINKIEGNVVWRAKVGLFSTASDFLKFGQMMLNGGELNGVRILSRKTIELMTLNHVGDLFYFRPGHGFGLGFAVMTNLAASNNLGSNGLYYWGGGFNTHFYIDPKERLVSLFMTQTIPYKIEYHNKMRQLVYQAIVD